MIKILSGEREPYDPRVMCYSVELYGVIRTKFRVYREGKRIEVKSHVFLIEEKDSNDLNNMLRERYKRDTSQNTAVAS